MHIQWQIIYPSIFKSFNDSVSTVKLCSVEEYDRTTYDELRKCNESFRGLCQSITLHLVGVTEEETKILSQCSQTEVGALPLL
jgi:hypothetical protein